MVNGSHENFLEVYVIVTITGGVLSQLISTPIA